MAHSAGWSCAAKGLRGLASMASIIAVSVLAACGGGGGGSGGGGDSGVIKTPVVQKLCADPNPPTPGNGQSAAGPGTFDLSGSITVSETSAVDSDLNDIRQSGYAINDSVARAQTLLTPVLAVGTVNLPGTGAAGTNFAAGDTDDFYCVDLVAGQVVELEFAADPSVSDVDLGLFSRDGSLVGVSEGTDTRFECIRVTRSGSYYIDVFAFSGASIYNLRIGAPGTSGSCANSTTSASMVPHELIAEPTRGVQSAGMRAGQFVRAARARLESFEVALASTGDMPSGLGPMRIQLPSDPLEQVAGVSALAGARQPALQKSRALSADAVGSRARAAAAQGLPDALMTLRYAKQLRATGAFEYVEPNWLMQTHAIVGAFPPDDRGYSYQRWHYEQIRLPAAMSRITALSPQPAQRPLVAVIDDGVVLDHPDLAPQLFSSGRAFVTGGDLATANNPATAADQPVFHGTHVSGTVAASTFDGIGAAGTAPMAQILPLRVFPARGGARSDDIVQAMRYAARLSNRSGLLPARRADVINMSLGGDRACDAAYQTAINDVRAAGVIVVVSSGNSGRNDLNQTVNVGSPANCNGAIAVSATDALGRVTYYSNTGAALDVAAPGGDSGQSTTGSGAPDNVYSDIATFDANGTRQPAFGGMMGTSMAAPHVAGVIALMRYVNPALTPSEVDALLAAGALTDDAGTLGRDNFYGNGRINAEKSVNAALNALAVPPAPPALLVTAQPSAIDFGAFQSVATLDLQVSGSTTERVVGNIGVVLPADAAPNAITITASAVDAAGLGRYIITIDRAAFRGSGSFYPELRFTLSSGRTISVQLSLRKEQSSVNSRADLGPIYVLLIDPSDPPDKAAAFTVLATYSNGRYTWSLQGYDRSSVQIIAGGDLDNDDLICQRGEPCGAFPVLPPGEDLAVIALTGSLDNLNFQVAPFSGISAARAGVSTEQTGWRKQMPKPIPAPMEKRQ